MFLTCLTFEIFFIQVLKILKMLLKITVKYTLSDFSHLSNIYFFFLKTFLILKILFLKIANRLLIT